MAEELCEISERRALCRGVAKAIERLADLDERLVVAELPPALLEGPRSPAQATGCHESIDLLGRRRDRPGALLLLTLLLKLLLGRLQQVLCLLVRRRQQHRFTQQPNRGLQIARLGELARLSDPGLHPCLILLALLRQKLAGTLQGLDIFKLVLRFDKSRFGLGKLAGRQQIFDPPRLVSCRSGALFHLLAPANLLPKAPTPRRLGIQGKRLLRPLGGGLQLVRLEEKLRLLQQLGCSRLSLFEA